MRKKSSENKSGNKLLYLIIVIIAFTVAFVLLINRQNEDNYYLNVKDHNFNISSKYGESIVARDGNAIYPRYYVAYIDGDQYTIYVYNYYDTISQYNLEYNRLIDKIVDYNIKDKMIRYIDSKGYGTYDEVLNNLSELVENENIQIY